MKAFQGLPSIFASSQPGKQEAELEVKKIYLNFGGVMALHNVDLKVCTGELVSVIGPNGAGKTSLMNCITGYYHPQKGEILFNGKEIAGHHPHEITPATIYRERVGNKTFSILGNPTLGELRGMLVGVENPYKVDGPMLSTEMWVNELRLSELDEHGGWAALGRVDVQMADLGTLSVSANTHTQGFGSIEQRVNERARDNLVQFDVATNIDAGKLVPKGARLSVPVYASINRTVYTPEYDPYDMISVTRINSMRLRHKRNGIPYVMRRLTRPPSKH